MLAQLAAQLRARQGGADGGGFGGGVVVDEDGVAIPVGENCAVRVVHIPEKESILIVT